ncbi:DUF6182 family protein [Alcanivorax sp.]|uniref:DUF6182 family protein n=1 Tax=Alcanivorax sp. TaxID=1872427 RepID=UPI002B26AC73|nr:DUF6182 family protein [Alcanivorax sp.]
MTRACVGPLERRVQRIGDAQQLSRNTALCVAVVESFSLHDYVHGLLAFTEQVKARGLEVAWLSSYTKTLFLAGRVDRQWLLPLLDIKVGGVGWTILAGDQGLQRLSGRLAPLVLQDVPLLPEGSIRIFSSGHRRTKLIYRRDVYSYVPWLVGMTHLLAEAYLAGELDDVGELVVEAVATPISILSSDLGVRVANGTVECEAEMVLRYD